MRQPEEYGAFEARHAYSVCLSLSVCLYVLIGRESPSSAECYLLMTGRVPR